MSAVAKRTHFSPRVHCPHCERQTACHVCELTDGFYACKGCQEVFFLHRLSDTVGMTESIGVCPACYDLVQVAADGNVQSAHQTRSRRICKGAGKPSLPPMRMGQILPEV